MKYTSIAAATILALAGTSPVLAAGDQSKSGQQSYESGSSMQGSTGASASSMQGQHDQQTIRQVQEQLSQKGHEVSVDGQMGPQTKQALKKFQKDEGLQASGQLDEKTLSALGIEGSQSGSVGGQGSMGSSGSADSQSGNISDTNSASGGASGGSSTSGSSGGMSGGSTGLGGSSSGGSSGGMSGGGAR